jgi:FlaA1/EpsC-like NDP-sugar epimerase
MIKMLKNLILNIKNRKVYASKWIVLIIDVFIVTQSYILANLLYYNFKIYLLSEYLFFQIPFIILFSLIGFLWIGSYKGIVRHTNIDDAINIFKAITISVVLSILVIYINRNTNIIPKKQFIPHSISILLIHYMVNLIILIASRFLFKKIYDHLIHTHKNKINVLIYGAGDSGLITLTTINNDPQSKYNVIGFIDDNPTKAHKFFKGKKCYYSNSITKKIIKENKIEQIIVSIQNIKPINLLKITDKLTLLNIKIKIVPPVEKWIDGDLKLNQIKDIKIEDLLNRQPIKIENPNIKKELSNKTILVTGAAGSIGSEICRQIINYPVKKIILLDQSESPLFEIQQELLKIIPNIIKTVIADIRDKNRLKKLFNQNKIDLIFHAAAYKHVPLMENNPFEAVNINIKGTKQLMDLAIEVGVEKFVMISTDKAVNPTNIMGATKRVAEIYAKNKQNENKTKFIITRFGNVLGSNGSVIPIFTKQINDGGPLTVTHKDISRFFMTIPEACQLVLEAGAMGKGGEIFVFDMGKSVKIFDLAVKMIQLSGLNYPDDIQIKITGLRPGEKLHEELLSDKEHTQPTHHNKIMIAIENDLNYEILGKKVNQLISNINSYSELELVKQLKEIVREYKSQNSKYSKLDL